MVLILWISQDCHKKKATNNFYSESEWVQIPIVNGGYLHIWKDPVSPMVGFLKMETSYSVSCLKMCSSLAVFHDNGGNN